MSIARSGRQWLRDIPLGRNLELESEVRELHSNLRALKSDLQDKVAELEQVRPYDSMCFLRLLTPNILF